MCRVPGGYCRRRARRAGHEADEPSRARLQRRPALVVRRVAHADARRERRMSARRVETSVQIDLQVTVHVPEIAHADAAGRISHGELAVERRELNQPRQPSAIVLDLDRLMRERAGHRPHLKGAGERDRVRAERRDARAIPRDRRRAPRAPRVDRREPVLAPSVRAQDRRPRAAGGDRRAVRHPADANGEQLRRTQHEPIDEAGKEIARADVGRRFRPLQRAEPGKRRAPRHEQPFERHRVARRDRQSTRANETTPVAPEAGLPREVVTPGTGTRSKLTSVDAK